MVMINITENLTIIGNPGCGKTKFIIDYCIHHFTKKSEFIIITFSNKAQIDFIEKGKRISNIFSNYNCKTIHKLAYLISKNMIKKSSESNLNTLILSTLKIIKNEDISQISFLKNCKIIFIDEAQDINENQYNLILEISNKLKIPLILVGDPNQSIYQFQGGTDKFLLNHSNSKHQLINNYRSSNEIVEFCKYLRPHNDLPPMECKTNINDDKPFIYINSLEEIKKHILNEINKGDCPLGDIAIIGSVKLSKNNFSIGLQQICNFLFDNNIKYIQYFKDTEKNTSFDINEKIEKKEDHINILTIHSSKGLEFKKVLCVNYHFKTFSRKPSQEDYNIFKYLWYVAFTRAINKLIIYVDETTEKNKIFPFISEVPKSLYNSNKDFKILKPEFDDIKCLSFPIIDTINNNKYFNENNYYRFENEFKYSIEKEELYKLDNVNDNVNEIFEYNKYSSLYGCFFQELFNYYWYVNNKSINDYINDGINKINNIFTISSLEKYKEYSKSIALLKKRGLIDSKNYINRISIEVNKNKLEKCERIFYDMIKTYSQIFITIDLCEYDKIYYKSLYNSLLINENKEEIIFKIVLYKYQFENECKRYLKFDWTNHISSTSIYYNHINNITINKPDYNLNVITRNNHIDIHGIMDIIDYKNKNIIELKFAKTIDIKHILQIFLYNNNYYFGNKMEIINLMTGIKYIYEFKNEIINFNYFLCDVLKIKMNNNIIILDIETNTIDEAIDFIIPENTEIIERYFYEYNFKTILSEGLIKNRYKLTTSHITGITDEDLKNSDNDYDIIKNDVYKFMKYMDKPTLIAHNGERFDFPILKYHNIINYEDINKKDTLYKLRLFIKDEIKSNKLINLHNFICKTKAIQKHRAKEDVILLINIFNNLNLSINQIISF